MPLKVFVSSEMKFQTDNDRRKAVIDELKELGHTPVVFEEWPGRPLPKDTSLLDYCRKKVTSSDIFLIIVDNEVSKAMYAEHKAALEHLGPKKIFYYFTKHGDMNSTARELWEKAKKGYIVKEFESANNLRKEIKRSIASYIEDALESKGKVSEIKMDEIIELESGEEWHEEFEFNEGDIVIITCLGDENFYAGFFSREEYVKRRGKDMFNFTFGTDCPQYTSKVRIPKDDDYYLVIRVGVYSDDAEINVKVRCDRNV